MTIDLSTIRQQNEERRKLKEFTTPTLWRFSPCTLGHPNNRLNPIVDSDQYHICRMFYVDAMAGMTSRAPDLLSEAEANAAFIAHARNDPIEETIDQLCDEIERLRDERQSMLMVIKAAARDS